MTAAATPQVSVAVSSNAATGRPRTMFENAASKIPQERLDATAEADKEQKARWLAGQPIYPAPVDQTSAADNAGQATSRLVGRAACSVALPWVAGRI